MQDLEDKGEAVQQVVAKDLGKAFMMCELADVQQKFGEAIVSTELVPMCRELQIKMELLDAAVIKIQRMYVENMK